ncbi:hypothetical protein [Paludifilum halophilum]|uniref:Uncharacterized protein n=1 Tax=Paludifilum halophilum TaxID=1642702 RepID=A0A235B5N0_9BACL|nr:hypothetical protein [Paludifilum halophilum]OYD07279.1 hypothetical protein CHM34_12950 [Paludifilum halophilum]
MHPRKPKHSLLLFAPDVDVKLSEEIIHWIYQGVKVYLFTMDSLETQEENDHWKQFRDQGIFRWREVPFHIDFADRFKQFVDGNVTPPVLYHISVNRLILTGSNTRWNTAIPTPICW